MCATSEAIPEPELEPARTTYSSALVAPRLVAPPPLSQRGFDSLFEPIALSGASNLRL